MWSWVGKGVGGWRRVGTGDVGGVEKQVSIENTEKYLRLIERE